MILINVRYIVRPEYQDTFLSEVDWFTQACRAEEGCLFFDWFRSEENPAEYFLVEGYLDGAGEAHVQSEHFQRATEELPKYFVETPKVINTTIEGKTEWDKLVEFEVN